MQGRGDLSLVVRIADRAERRLGHLEQRVRGSDGLGPLAARLRLVGTGESAGRLAVERGVVRHVGTPPRVGRDVIHQRAERGDVRGEQQHLGDRGQLRLESLLGSLLPEGVEVRGQRAVAVDLAVLGLELRDHRGVVSGPVCVGAAVDDLIAGRLDQRLESLPERGAVRVVRVHAGHFFVVLDPVPHRHEAALELRQAEEEHGAVLEGRGRLERVAAQAGVP